MEFPWLSKDILNNDNCIRNVVSETDNRIDVNSWLVCHLEIMIKEVELDCAARQLKFGQRSFIFFNFWQSDFFQTLIKSNYT